MTTVGFWTGAETAVLRKAMRLSVRNFAARLGVDTRTVTKWEGRGASITLLPETQAIMDTALSQAAEDAQARFAELLRGSGHTDDQVAPRGIPPRAVLRPLAAATDIAQAELLRREVHEALTEGAMTDASLDDWEQTVISYGEATRHRAAGLLLTDLTADFEELKRALSRCRSASTLRRLARVAAHMSGLMCLTLVKLHDRSAFRSWARTARVAAIEAGDPVTHSWVLAQEAYGHYYSDDLTDAINVAQQAQAVLRTTPAVGAVLAAALEARAHAAHGRSQETRLALAHAETILSRLDDGDMVASAFGYNEAQLRFHESNALTHLGETRAAWRAQERALELVAPGDYMDRAFTQLDRAMCLAHDGDGSAATAYATETLSSLTEPQRQGIISLRAEQLLNTLPANQRALRPARQLRDLVIVTTSEPKE